MAKTKKPTGLKLTRNGNSWKAEWKIADKDYGDGQTFQYRCVPGAWIPLSVGNKATSKTFSFGASIAVIPGSTSVEFRVKGNRKSYKETTGSGKNRKTKTINPSASDWATCSFAIYTPPTPSASATRADTAYRANFSWSVAYATPSSNYPFNFIEYQSMLIRECNVANGASLNWSTAQLGWTAGSSTAASGTIPIDDTPHSTSLALASYTRWFRVRAYGDRGTTGWAYGCVVYAKPYQSRNVSVAMTYLAAGYGVRVNWISDANLAHPIGTTTVQYAMETPLENKQCPPNAQWTDVSPVFAGGSGSRSAAFNIGAKLETDKCLFVRVNNTYYNETAYGVSVFAANGNLADPSGMSIEVNNYTFRATITATNNSAVPDSALMVTFMTNKDPKGFVVGVIPHGQTSITVQCPDWSTATTITFAVQAFVGTAKKEYRPDGADAYSINSTFKSANTITQGGAVPQVPRNIGVTATDTPGTIRVTWAWSWDEATGAQIAWADHEDAWESTEEPNIYTVNNINASAWNVSGLATGQTWYVRMRYVTGTGDVTTYGPWSNIVPIDLSSAPAIPVLILSDGVITAQGSVTASWVYSTTDGSTQAYAEIAEYTLDGTTPVYTPLVQVRTAQYVTLAAKDYGWEAGESHALVVRVRSASGHLSDGWSDPVNLIIAEPLNLSISNTSLVEQTVTPEEGDPYTIMALTQMPLDITISGTKLGTNTTVVIERAAAYFVDRPDESVFNGYEGETIAILKQSGDGTLQITKDDLIGALDDTAAYRIIATVQDSFGQSKEVTVDFEVHWEHQAIIPKANVYVDEEQLISVMTPVAPEGTATGDTCDIYRLSADKPQLIVQGAEFGKTYVDPFPTIGEFGGHRFVFRTLDGDYITEDNHLAWLDTKEEDGDYLDLVYSVVNFGTGRVELLYDATQKNSWTKDFQETKYLGGSIQGDWNPAVEATSSLEAAMVTIEDQESMNAMRRLAVWPGACHIRTVDGSSYPCDIQVSEDRRYDRETIRATYSLSITKVDPEELDGMTLEEWNELHQEAE